MPLATEHQGVCAYSAHHRLCEMPSTCRARTPSSERLQALSSRYSGTDGRYKCFGLRSGSWVCCCCGVCWLDGNGCVTDVCICVCARI